MKRYLLDITSHLNRRIRCIIWKQWKVARHRIKCLIKLGRTRDEAKTLAYSRKSYWNTSMTLTLNVAISNKRLKQKGLIFPIEYYLKIHTLM